MADRRAWRVVYWPGSGTHLLRRSSRPRGLRSRRTRALGASGEQSDPQRRRSHRDRRPHLRRRHPPAEQERLPVQGTGRPRTSGLHPGACRGSGRRRRLDALRDHRARPGLRGHCRAGPLRGPGIHPLPRVLHDGHRNRTRMAGCRDHRGRRYHGPLRRALPRRPGTDAAPFADRTGPRRPDRTLLKLQRPRGRHQLARPAPGRCIGLGGRHHHARSPLRRPGRHTRRRPHLRRGPGDRRHHRANPAPVLIAGRLCLRPGLRLRRDQRQHPPHQLGRPLRLGLRATDPRQDGSGPGAGRHRAHAPPLGHPAAGQPRHGQVRAPGAVAAGDRGADHHGSDVRDRRRAGALCPAAAHHFRPRRFAGLHPLRLRAAAGTDPGPMAHGVAARLALDRRRRSSPWCPTSSAYEGC